MSKEWNSFQPRDWETIGLEVHKRMADGVRLDLCDKLVKYLASDLPDDIKERLPCGEKIDVCCKEMKPEDKVFVNKQ